MYLWTYLYSNVIANFIYFIIYLFTLLFIYLFYYLFVYLLLLSIMHVWSCLRDPKYWLKLQTEYKIHSAILSDKYKNSIEFFDEFVMKDERVSAPENESSAV